MEWSTLLSTIPEVLGVAESTLLIGAAILLLLPVVPSRRRFLGVGEESSGGVIGIAKRELSVGVFHLGSCDDCICSDSFIDHNGYSVGGGNDVVVGGGERVRDGGYEFPFIDVRPGCRKFFAKFEQLR